MAAGSTRLSTPRSSTLSAVLLLALLCVPHAVTAASWQTPVDVIYVDTGAPVPADAAEAAIRYALASWAARVDLPLRWAGSTTDAAYREGSYAKGAVIIRWLDPADSLRAGNSLLSLASTRRWIYSASGAIAAAEIQLRRAAFVTRENDACFTHVVLHELGHALGIGHLPDKGAVMHKDLSFCHHTLTEADITAAPYPQHVCHAELLQDFTIYVPVINIGARSFASRLHYDAGVWSVAEYAEVPRHPECDDTYLLDGNLVLARLWTAQHEWHGELQSAGHYRWSLTSPADSTMPKK